jgi:hypothetical protein
MELLGSYPRLFRGVFGGCIGTNIVDNSFNYNKNS